MAHCPDPPRACSSILGLKIGSPVIKDKKPTTRHKRHVPHFF